MGVVAAAIFFVIFMNFQDRFAVFNREESLDDSYDFRFEIWKKAFKIYTDHSTLGIGIGNYQSYVAKYSQDQYWIVDDGKNLLYYDHPESGYLKFLAELGWVGFALTFSLIIVPMTLGMWLYLRIKDERLLFLTASICSWALGFYSVYSFGDVRITILIATLVSLLIHFTYIGSNPQLKQHGPV
jgi:O-antigen ligase